MTGREMLASWHKDWEPMIEIPGAFQLATCDGLYVVPKNGYTGAPARPAAYTDYVKWLCAVRIEGAGLVRYSEPIYNSREEAQAAAEDFYCQLVDTKDFGGPAWDAVINQYPLPKDEGQPFEIRAAGDFFCQLVNMKA